jgi:O-antigen/teichoic acid export membrane protein
VDFHKRLLFLVTAVATSAFIFALTIDLGPNLLFIPVLSLAVIFEFHVETQLTIQIARGKSFNTVLSTLLRRVAPLGFFALFTALTTGHPTLNAAVSLVAGGTLGLIHVYFSNQIRLFHLSPKIHLDDLWPELKPTLANQLLVTTRNLEIPLVSFLSGPIQAAAFSVGQRFANPIALFTSSLGSTLLPRMVASNRGEAKRTFVKILYGALTSTIVIVLALPIVPALVSVLFGTKYEFASVTICIILACSPFISITSAATAIVIGRGQYSQATKIAWVYSACLLVLVALGAFFFGANGAALASLAAALVRLALTHNALTSN